MILLSRKLKQLNAAELLYLPPSDEYRFLPEGPYPLETGRFSWVAIQHGPSKKFGSLHIFDLSSKTDQSFDLPGRPGFAFPTDRGNFVVGCERQVGIFSTKDSSFRSLIHGIDSGVENTIINDGVTWDGNLIFGCKDLEFRTKKAGLYFWRGRDRQLFRLRDDQICSNGKVIHNVQPGRIELFDIDSPTRKVVRYQINTELGIIESERVLVDLSAVSGVPDGMTSTPDGKSIIVSLYNPDPAPFGRTLQISIESGDIEKTWTTLDSPQATCPQLIQWNGRLWMIITTAVEYMPRERQNDSKNAGGLFIVDLDLPLDAASYRNLVPQFVEPS